MFIIKEFLIFMIQQVCGPNSQSDLKTEYYNTPIKCSIKPYFCVEIIFEAIIRDCPDFSIPDRFFSSTALILKVPDQIAYCFNKFFDSKLF